MSSNSSGGVVSGLIGMGFLYLMLSGCVNTFQREKFESANAWATYGFPPWAVVQGVRYTFWNPEHPGLQDAKNALVKLEEDERIASASLLPIGRMRDEEADPNRRELLRLELESVKSSLSDIRRREERIKKTIEKMLDKFP